MTSQQLQVYLRELVDLEIKYRSADKVYQQHKKDMVGYGIPTQYKMPEKPEKPSITNYLLIPCVILGGILLIVLLWTVMPSLKDLTRIERIRGSAPVGQTILWILKFILVVVAAFFTATMVWVLWDDIRYSRRHYRYDMHDYKNDIAKYNALVSKEQARMQRQQPRLPAQKQKGQLLSEQRERAWNTLQKFYDLGILHKDYRNMVCVTTFLDYLEKGICTTLTGHEGCYVLFEQQARMGIIISKLTNIENKLDQIQENQRYLLAAMDSIESSCRNISQKINSLDYKMGELIDEAKIQSYTTQQIAAEQQAMNNYVIIRDWMLL